MLLEDKIIKENVIEYIFLAFRIYYLRKISEDSKLNRVKNESAIWFYKNICEKNLRLQFFKYLKYQVEEK
jgi:hypothetical protein